MAGRAARNLNGTVIFYADQITGSMARALEETSRRREIQERYNHKMGITPQSILKPVKTSLLEMAQIDYYEIPVIAEEITEYSSPKELDQKIFELTQKMRNAAEKLEFEKAAGYRDQIQKLKELQLQYGGTSHEN
jgi:excinuclease ABC subunit B